MKWTKCGVECTVNKRRVGFGINHENVDVVAYVLGSRKREMLEKLNDTLNSLNLNITHVYSDNNFAYHDVISHKILKIGKINTQKIERKHLTFRTRFNHFRLKPEDFIATESRYCG